MIMEHRCHNYQQLTVIVHRGDGHFVNQLAKEIGVSGKTSIYGFGYGTRSLLDFFGLVNEEREIFYFISDPVTIENLFTAIGEKFGKRHHGLVYIQALSQVSGCHRLRKNEELNAVLTEIKGENMQELITIIVNRGQAENVLEMARTVGAKGGTILNARGAGVHETQHIFKSPIEPEKEILLLLVDNDKVDGIMSKIEEGFAIHEAGKGIMYSQPVLRSAGLVEE